MTNDTPLACENPLYTHIVGTGGIGSGMFFLLEGNQTLTRNESRLGRQLPCRDYCKLHTMLHYVAVLMGAAEGAFEVYPVGMVGDDDRGWSLLAEMDSVGMITRGVTVTKDAATLFSVCYQYPDSTGGNITTSNGAGLLMKAAHVASFFKTFKARGRGMALAVPEVPLEARIALLIEGRSRGWLNAASFSATEAAGFAALGGLKLTDLLVVNLDEAAALAGMDVDEANPMDIVRFCMEACSRQNHAAMLVVTDGPRGGWAGCGERIAFLPPLPVRDPVNAAGAGDALLSGTLAGLACGLPFLKDAADGRFAETPLDSAVELGILLASFSVTSADTIHWGADAMALKRHAASHGVKLSERFAALFPAKAANGRTENRKENPA